MYERCRPNNRRRRTIRHDQHAQPRWVRPGVLALLAATAVLYLWGLAPPAGPTTTTRPRRRPARRTGRPGCSDRWTRATRSRSTSRPPRMWVMGLSGRLFGFNAFTMLLPQALMGVAAVAAAVSDRAAHQRTGRGSDRRCGAGADPGRGADVPVQQPRRAAGAAAGGRRVLHGAGDRDGKHPLDGVGGLRHRLRVPDEDVAGVPDRARSRAGVPRRGAGRHVEADRQATRRRRHDDRVGGVVHRTGQPVARRLAPLHRRLHRQQPAAAGVGLQRD